MTQAELDQWRKEVEATEREIERLERFLAECDAPVT